QCSATRRTTSTTSSSSSSALQLGGGGFWGMAARTYLDAPRRARISSSRSVVYELTTFSRRSETRSIPSPFCPPDQVFRAAGFHQAATSVRASLGGEPRRGEASRRLAKARPAGLSKGP